MNAPERLIDERGYDRTTVRDIAEAAGVTERTFFRYFAAKEDLALDEILSGVDRFVALIRVRPTEERAIQAIGAALAVMETELRASSRPNILHLFADSRPAELIRRRGRRALPARILAVEEALIAPFAERLRLDGHCDDAMIVLRAEALARLTVAAVRTVLLRDLEWRCQGTDHLTVGDALAVVFADLAEGWPRP